MRQCHANTPRHTHTPTHTQHTHKHPPTHKHTDTDTHTHTPTHPRTHTHHTSHNAQHHHHLQHHKSRSFTTGIIVTRIAVFLLLFFTLFLGNCDYLIFRLLHVKYTEEAYELGRGKGNSKILGFGKRRFKNFAIVSTV